MAPYCGSPSLQSIEQEYLSIEQEQQQVRQVTYRARRRSDDYQDNARSTVRVHALLAKVVMICCVYCLHEYRVCATMFVRPLAPPSRHQRLCPHACTARPHHCLQLLSPGLKPPGCRSGPKSTFLVGCVVSPSVPYARQAKDHAKTTSSKFPRQKGRDDSCCLCVSCSHCVRSGRVNFLLPITSVCITFQVRSSLWLLQQL